MAINRLVIDGYGQVELNNAAFRRDGRIEAQCKLDGTAFANKYAENGMILAIDNVTRTVKLPGGSDAASEYVALNYSSEHLYEGTGLKNFKLGVNDVYPRLGYLSRGDKFTTNCISYNTTDWADDATLKGAVLTGTGAVTIYASESTDGSILLKKGTTKPTGTAVVLKAIQITTMPDGQWAIQFQVL